MKSKHLTAVVILAIVLVAGYMMLSKPEATTPADGSSDSSVMMEDDAMMEEDGMMEGEVEVELLAE